LQGYESLPPLSEALRSRPCPHEWKGVEVDISKPLTTGMSPVNYLKERICSHYTIHTSGMTASEEKPVLILYIPPGCRKEESAIPFFNAKHTGIQTCTRVKYLIDQSLAITTDNPSIICPRTPSIALMPSTLEITANI
jgi:hypothetical protein